MKFDWSEDHSSQRALQFTGGPEFSRMYAQVPKMKPHLNHEANPLATRRSKLFGDLLRAREPSPAIPRFTG